MSSRISLALALLLSSSAALADIDGPGWDVQQTRFRLQPELLDHEGTERGYVRSPTFSWHAVGHAPIGVNDSDETYAAGGGLRLEVDVPLLTFVSIGGYLEGSWRGFYSRWEYEYVHFGVIDAGAHARLRLTAGAMSFFVGAHAGITRTEGYAQLFTWHGGGHAGMRAGGRVGVVIQMGITMRDWHGDEIEQRDDTFEKPFPELFGSVGMSFVLGDYR